MLFQLSFYRDSDKLFNVYFDIRNLVDDVRETGNEVLYISAGIHYNFGSMF